MFRADFLSIIRLPETCRVVITIKLELGASVGFIHKKYVTMHSHMTIKFRGLKSLPNLKDCKSLGLNEKEN